MNKTVDTRICEVTVYDDQALITRRGVVHLTGEEHELVIAQLPVTLVSESVRASGVGTVAVQLLGVRTERTHATEVVNQEIAQLTQEIAQLEEQKRHVHDQLTLLTLQRNFVKSLSTQYLERLTKLQNPEPLNLAQIQEVLEFVGQQYSKFSNAIARSEKEQLQLGNQLQALRQQQQQLSTPRAQEYFNIIITLEPFAAGEVELEVSYVVHQVSWLPVYDLRFSGASEKVNLSYSAEVKQSSGEDWSGVTLTLSTAKPGLGTLPPKSLPWYIDVQNSSYPGRRVKTIAESGSMLASGFNLPFPGTTLSPEVTMDAEKELLKAEMAATGAFKQGSVVTFEVSRAANIPSDGAGHKTTIFTEDYPYRSEYIAMPRLMNLSYRQATITNPLSAAPLLPGKANIFRDNTFVGTTQLEHIAPGQDFEINLGIDEGLKIDRVLVERQVDKKLIGNQRRITYAYRLVITNLRELPTDLTLSEQLPVSCTEQIKVRLTDSHPEIQKDEMGILKWSLILPPESKQELYYQFTVEHPPELAVVGLDI